MLLEFEITHCSRQCAATGRTFAPGETYFSTLRLDGGSPVRSDYSADAWSAPPCDFVAWWKSRMPDADGGKPKLAPQDVLVNLFIELADQPAEAEFRYVLGLLLLRRRIMKLEETRREGTVELMVLDCPRLGEQFQLVAAVPDAERTEVLQRRLVDLLYGGA